MSRKRKRSRDRSRGVNTDPDAGRIPGPTRSTVNRAHRRADQRIPTIGKLPSYRDRMARKAAGLEPVGVSIQYRKDAQARAVDQRPLPSQHQKKEPEKKLPLKRGSCKPRPKTYIGNGTGRKFAGRYCK